MNFEQLIRLYENEIVFQYPGEDEELARDKVYSIQQFEKWFKKNESKLIWNEQAQGYDSNTDINIFLLNLYIIPIQFNIVKGNFSCSFNYLILLKGCPKEIKGNFYCHNNKLKSLKGCPEEIEGNFDCSHNSLISLEGCPKEVGGHFDCYYNNLISLEGCPKKVGGNFNCSHNQVKFTEEEVRSRCNVRGKIII